MNALRILKVSIVCTFDECGRVCTSLRPLHRDSLTLPRPAIADAKELVSHTEEIIYRSAARRGACGLQ